MSSLLPLLIALLWGSVVFYWFIVLGAPKRAKLVAGGPLAKIFMPAITTLAPLFAGGDGRKLTEKLTIAGLKLGYSEFRAARVVTLVIFATLGWLFDSSIETSPILASSFGLLGFFYPDIYLSGLIERRHRKVFRDLPDILDIIRLAITAGLDLTSALRVVVENVAQGPLLSEFELVERDIALGATRGEALEKMAKRISLEDVNAFVLAIKQADELGAPIGPILAVQSEMARDKRYQVADAIIGRLPTKLLGPLVACIFPASFIVLFTPFIVDYLQSGF